MLAPDATTKTSEDEKSALTIDQATYNYGAAAATTPVVATPIMQPGVDPTTMNNDVPTGCAYATTGGTMYPNPGYYYPNNAVNTVVPGNTYNNTDNNNNAGTTVVTYNMDDESYKKGRCNGRGCCIAIAIIVGIWIIGGVVCVSAPHISACLATEVRVRIVNRVFMRKFSRFARSSRERRQAVRTSG